MPAASCRTRPARSISRWLIASASAGSSRSVGISDLANRIEAGGRSVDGGRQESLRPALLEEGLDLLAHGLDDLPFGHLADHRAPLEDEPDALAAGDADVGRARLAGPVHLAAHDGDVDLLVEALELVLDLLRELDEVDVRPAAGGTGHERETALAQAERLQDVDPDRDLLGRVRGERHADRVADALREQGPEPDRRLDGPHARRPRLGHAEVERVLDLVGEHSVGL